MQTNFKLSGEDITEKTKGRNSSKEIPTSLFNKKYQDFVYRNT